MSQLCPSCETRVRVDGAAWARCNGCRAMVFAPTGGPPVVVAHESERIAARIGVALAGTRFQPLHAPRGSVALGLVETRRPVAAVLDVGLSEPMSFQIIERMRSTPELAATKVVLVASVFNKTAYKRRPRSLYGADDYVEQHHIHDMLPRKLCGLLGLAQPPESRAGGLSEPDVRDELPATERVRSLARSIAADIVLYHPEEIARTGAGARVLALERALEEGRRLLTEMTGGARPAGDPVGDAFGALVATLDGRRR